ncbi:MBL fold metallo-hydrolase [Streptomyces sp. MUM 203J]|uniref:MBL fold metallo-hydrolase n=1 Tax=Streptomyces sp. MUM 203J TaxID=2791990 RepID=UPI001F0431F6|nr:MBL fold metallo-hydrolase [Streptomyces sp. MUM 203J]MCH0538824.1 MBL fold metallo-hydrolase [Streptomyces sp. MUM 203J]
MNGIVSIHLKQSTAHAVLAEHGTVLVDAGPAGSARTLLRRLGRAGVDPDGISLIVLTHCHPDHAGGAAELSRELRAPVAVHSAEVDWATTGTSRLYEPQRLFGRILRSTLNPAFPAFTPDLVLEDGATLDAYGPPLTVLHTPGHTPGSITLLHHPDGSALLGDLLTGGMLRRDRPGMPFLAQDPAQVTASVRAVLEHGPNRLLFGHGRPASATAARRLVRR